MSENTKQEIKKQLGIVIITANRADTVRVFLEKILEPSCKLGIDVIVFDSSLNEDTKQICEDFNKKGFRHIIYKRYNGSTDILSIDNKVIDAYELYCKSYEYLWLTRDGLAINLNNVYEGISEKLRQKFDLIILDELSRDYKKHGNKIYTDCQKLFLEQCHQMTILGSTILKSDHIQAMIKEVPLDKEKKYGIWQPMAYLTYFAKHKFKAASWVGMLWLPNEAASPSSFWHKRVFWQWGERWYKSISALPNVYDKYKPKIMKFKLVDCRPFSFEFLLKIRQAGSLDISTIKKYKEYLPYVCNTPLWKFYIIALTPIWLIKKFQYLVRNYKYFIKYPQKNKER